VPGKEVKYYGAVSSASATTSGTILPLTRPIIQGITQTQRLGSQIKLVRSEFNLIAKASTAVTAGDTTYFRFIIFRDNQAFAADPAVTNVLRSATVVSGYGDPVYLARKFTVLHDKTYSLSYEGPSAISDRRVIPMGSIVTYYNTTDASSASGPGSLYALFITDQGTNSPSYSLDWTIHFTDS